MKVPGMVHVLVRVAMAVIVGMAVRNNRGELHLENLHGRVPGGPRGDGKRYLKESGIKSVLSILQQFKKRRRLADIVQRHRCRTRCRTVQVPIQFPLQTLPL